MEDLKEERSEYVGMYVTPTIAKQLKEAGDNERLKEKLLKQFVTQETDWLKDEIHNMDEITTIYRAKLLTIRDGFSKAQDIYVEEIENLIGTTDNALKPLGGKFKSLEKEVEHIKNNIESTSKMVESLSSKIGYIDCSKLERLLEVVEKFNKMSDSEKELIRLVLERS